MNILSGGVSAVALAFTLGMAAQANAQLEPPTAPSSSLPGPSGATPASGNVSGPAGPQPAAGTADDGGLEDIVVTAQKRVENVQNVPIAITAVGGAQLAKTSASVSTTNLQQFVPGLVQGRSGTSGATFLRGVGTEAGTVGVESPVPTYIDGVYLGINALGVFELNNVEQISVLKGPQGTLFGRNSSGGAIQITTKNPSLTKPEASVEAGYGNYDTATVRGYISVPLTPTLGINLAGFYKHRDDGTVLNVFTGNRLQAEKTVAAQGKLLWQPDSDTRIVLNGIYSRGKDLPGINYYVQKGAVSQDGINRYLGPRTVNLIVDPYQATRLIIGALTVAHDFGAAKLTNTFAHTRYDNKSSSEQSMTTSFPNAGSFTPPAGALPYTNITPSFTNLNGRVREITDEIQLTSSDRSKLKWIVGFFYFNDQTTTDLRARNFTAYRGTAAANNGNFTTVPGFGLNTEARTDSYAGYGQATYEVFEKTNVTAGLRYTLDQKTFAGSNVFGGTVPRSLQRSVSFGKLTWRFALDHKFGDNVLGYASYNRGFRAGTYSLLSLTNPPAAPETLDAYEAGLKTDLFDRKVRVNVAGFYYDYSNLQFRENRVENNVLTSLTRNAAKARIYGLDVDFEARVTRSFRAFGGAEYLNSKYRSFPFGPSNFPVGQAQLGLAPITAAPAGCVGTPRRGVGGHSANVGCDLAGNELINAPKWSATLGADYTLPTSIGEFVLSVADKYTGRSFATPDNIQKLQSYHYVTASLGWTAPNERFFGKVYVTNLTNNGRPAQLAFGLNTYEFLPSDPRFYGFTVGFKY